MARSVEDLESAARTGEWLRPGDVALVLGVSRTAVVRMLNADPPALRYRIKPGSGRHRECHPDDVIAALEQRRQVHGDQ
ncbi:DNA-binding protein [Micromonospora zingiberis]|uniref:DNA-binding protein n=1 Tax=Micromonospora zingiberis TaxID=2053011 RepID=A0A4R0GQ14_9ACTN|nr:helix-turn-helix domain-containing protein [Micromonospora zingiberis]TCB97598.1 DNA-binding protein [Micromonospora zingiberis]